MGTRHLAVRNGDRPTVTIDDIPVVTVILDTAEDFDEAGIYKILVRDVRGRLTQCGTIFGLKNILLESDT